VLVKAASGGSLLYDQCVPFAILKPKNEKRQVRGAHPQLTQPTRESALITRARENLLRFSVLFFFPPCSPPSSLPWGLAPRVGGSRRRALNGINPIPQDKQLTRALS
jgi:hypothetical protein